LYPRSTSHTNAMYNTLNILTLRNLFLYRIVLNNYYEQAYRTPRIYNANTRIANHIQFAVPSYHTLYGRRMRQVLLPTIFNLLPRRILNLTSFAELKCDLKDFLKTNDISTALI